MKRHARGVSLIELLVAMMLGLFVLMGIIQVFLSTRQSYDAQQDATALAQDATFALDRITEAAAAAGFSPSPWELPAFTPVGPASRENGIADELQLQTLSQQNCYGRPNSTLDANGNPRFFRKIENFFLATDGSLRWRCDYLDPDGGGSRQSNSLSLTQRVAQFQVLYGEDLDLDLAVDSWVRADAWRQRGAIRALKVGLVLEGSTRVQGIPEDNLRNASVLLGEIQTISDGRLRRIYTSTLPLANTLP